MTGLKSKKTLVFLSVMFLALFAIGCGETLAQKTEKAPSFEINDINGQKFGFSEHAGKIVILNFFATWCPPCRMEMPDFNEIAKEYKGKVEILAINVGRESVSKVKGFVKENSLEFRVAMDDGKISNLYQTGPMIPVTIIIDKNSNIARRYVGLRTKAELVKDIEELLK